MKNGKYKERQRYRCQRCGYRFKLKKRKTAKTEKLWQEYVHGKQTYQQLSKKYGCSIRTVQNILDKHKLRPHYVEPQETPLVIDAMFFGRTAGVLVFRSPTLKKNLGWYTITKERVDDYELGVFELCLSGFEITGVTVDGKPGVIQRLEKFGLPVQMCHFHQIQIVTRYTTCNPRLLAAQELKHLARQLPHTDRASFEHWLNQWHLKWKDFLSEKTYDEDGKYWYYTHQRLRRAHRSLKKHLPYLFTYLDHKDLPNTTNSLDGTFSHFRDKIRVHRGLRYHRKLQLLFELLR